MKLKLFFLIIFCMISVVAQQHPNLLLNKNDIEVIKKEWDKYPLFKETFLSQKAFVDKALIREIEVPEPIDAGGYTHEKHKQNYTEMQLAGFFYSVTGEKKYAEFIKSMLLKYAVLYPTLGLHIKQASKSPGRLFWQALNESVWLVNTSQAYDFIYDYLSESERKTIENGVLRPMAKFLSEERVEELDLIHNHGTWSCASVGMAGFVLKDKNLIDKSLYGSKKNGEAGFLKQIDLLFSPDGYYNEGAYYIRYAIMPFIYFSKVIDNNMPQLKIFESRDKILQKALNVALQLTYTDGAFIPFNDALKEKNYLSPELVIALDVVFDVYGKDKGLLPVAKIQNNVMLSKAGLEVAKALFETKDPGDYKYKSMELTDGPNGKNGGLGLLRSGPNSDQSLLLMKYSSHGLSHGHYDKLSFLYYDQNREIVQDYGAARFINVEPKYGGRYLPETKTWCFQSVAHNTIVVNQKSHYDGKQEISSKNNPDKHFYNDSDENFQIMSAKDKTAYPGVEMQRTMAMINDKLFTKPIIIDIFRIKSDVENIYDYPLYYLGHLIYSNVKYKSYDENRTVLGKKNGYQHLWVEAEAENTNNSQVSWMNGNRYYTFTTNATNPAQLFFTRIGAKDPDFNLRNEPGLLFRYKAKNNTIVSCLEPHGLFDGVKEISRNTWGTVKEVKVLASDDESTVISIKGNNINWVLMISNGNPSETTEHSVVIEGVTYNWKGNYSLKKN